MYIHVIISELTTAAEKLMIAMNLDELFTRPLFAIFAALLFLARDASAGNHVREAAS
jgi:hypothetical protein